MVSHVQKIVVIVLTLTISHLALSSEGIVHRKRELRGVWVASVKNIDWPATSNMSVVEQKQSIRDMLDMFQEIGMNAIVMQIRPAADAFYNSPYEPWSVYLAGEQGKATTPYYDPLRFITEEAHKRCMELHAWVNPYRVSTDTSIAIDSSHVYYDYPEWFITYGKQIFFNPGIPEAREFVVNVLGDIVRRYDIDAIHMDDYFYPYKLAGVPFPDTSTYLQYNINDTSIADWRRRNVNLMVEEVSQRIHDEKPYVQFGISPFSIWRNKKEDPRGSNTDAFTNYDGLYADVYHWLKNHWLDYIAPQCYFHIGFERADYTELVNWWSNNNFGTNLYIGEAPYRMIRPRKYKEWGVGNEMKKHLYYIDTIPNVQGQIYFSARSFYADPKGIKGVLKNSFYKYPALPPASFKYKGTFNSAKIYDAEISATQQNTFLTWETTQEDNIRYYVIYAFDENEVIDLTKVENIVTLTAQRFVKIKNKRVEGKRVYVTAVNKYRIESEPRQFR